MNKYTIPYYDGFTGYLKGDFKIEASSKEDAIKKFFTHHKLPYSLDEVIWLDDIYFQLYSIIEI